MFEVYATTESADDNPKRVWQYVGTKSKLTEAKKIAKKQSKDSKWFEIEVRGEKEGETIHHTYWRKGKVEINMLN